MSLIERAVKRMDEIPAVPFRAEPQLESLKEPAFADVALADDDVDGARRVRPVAEVPRLAAAPLAEDDWSAAPTADVASWMASISTFRATASSEYWVRAGRARPPSPRR